MVESARGQSGRHVALSKMDDGLQTGRLDPDLVCQLRRRGKDGRKAFHRLVRRIEVAETDRGVGLSEQPFGRESEVSPCDGGTDERLGERGCLQEGAMQQSAP